MGNNLRGVVLVTGFPISGADCDIYGVLIRVLTGWSGFFCSRFWFGLPDSFWIAVGVAGVEHVLICVRLGIAGEIEFSVSLFVADW